LTLKGQRVNQVQFDEGHKKLIIRCDRDKRKSAIDPVTGQNGRINQLIKWGIQLNTVKKQKNLKLIKKKLSPTLPAVEFDG